MINWEVSRWCAQMLLSIVGAGDGVRWVYWGDAAVHDV